MKLRFYIGMLKSRLIYDYKPFIRIKMKRFYSRFIQPGDLCFDIGSHTGNRSDVWLKMGAIVVAAEPQPAFARLIDNKLGRKKNFTLLQMAIGDRQELTQLQISYLHPAISTVSENWVQVMKEFDFSVNFDESIEISITTLDHVIEQFGFPQFCKIDVEGYEEQVLMGLSSAIPSLSFEFFPTTLYHAVKCIDLLEVHSNYTYNWSLTETFKFRNKKWMSATEMKHEIIGYTGRRSGDIYAILKKP